MNTRLTVTRRRFLQTSFVATAALTMGRGFAQAPTRPVRLGMIGTGNRGLSLLHTLLLFPEADVRAVCDLLPDHAQSAARMIEQRTQRRPEVYAGDELAWEKLVARADLDAVIIATPWDWHTRMATAAMRAGKYPGVEVPAAISTRECWDLVRTSERTGIPCMMLENVCYFERVLTLLRMVREGVFGEVLHCEAGYQHDCRSLMFDAQDKLTWRGLHSVAMNGNLYPTHGLGPAAQWMNINRGDRFVTLTSMSTPARGLKHYAAQELGPDHKLARLDYVQGDVNTTLLKTARGMTVTLYYSTLAPRPYDLILRLQGVNGIYLDTNQTISLEQPGKGAEQWEPFAPYLQKYPHPLWRTLGAAAAKSGGHEGAEYLMFHDFLKSVRNKAPGPQDVYDAAAWSAVVGLSLESVARGGKLVEFPDFTRGKWKTTPPLPVYAA
ncbi:MAG TPA: Gfo/Idh/MocA family oxidoreductase [Verrucomicrobiota bacterium]|jgi:predicted dehydrogenase|nr:Gfo/Idh/MocA family oxidoreductase [Verrucomicrobiota bacterium]HQL78119.1 Gfo/Idh/MocA family oxidoreductase [Verrucomicrobiota bacterium]